MVGEVSHIECIVDFVLYSVYGFNVTVPPSIPMAGEVSHIEAVEGKIVYISCDADGIPRPSIMWFKDTTPLLDFPYENLREINNGRQLEIRAVTVRLWESIATTYSICCKP